MDEPKIVFSGSWFTGLQKPNRSDAGSAGPLSGLNIDLAEWCELSLTEDQYDKFMNATTELEILRNCINAEYVETHEIDSFSTGADVFFEILATDIRKLKSEVKAEILAILDD